GNVAVNTLKILRSKPRCVRAVTNPVAALGGADVPPVNNIRVQAPQSLQNTGVIVSRDDYRYFARNFAGVVANQLDDLKVRGRDIVVLTIITEQSQPAEPICADLKKAIKHYQVNKMRVEVLPAQLLPFQLRVQILAEDNIVWAELKTTVKHLLAQTYGLRNRCPGEAVQSAQIISLVQATPGVRSAHLQQLSLVTKADINHSTSQLTAKRAVYCASKKTYSGAEVLISCDFDITVIVGELA
ncbi:MAG: baseplate J/gp47 family protein, partial [Algicola sp.]|nr:baseplate J/gp47 family protein [Algicola sp.]